MLPKLIFAVLFLSLSNQIWAKTTGTQSIRVSSKSHVGHFLPIIKALLIWKRSKQRKIHLAREDSIPGGRNSRRFFGKNCINLKFKNESRHSTQLTRRVKRGIYCRHVGRIQVRGRGVYIHWSSLKDPSIFGELISCARA